MIRPTWLVLLALAACGGPALPPPLVATPVAAGPAVCRVGPDGGRPIADRGIGGTGAPTGQTADRGIGGTGIIGVITGFASVCVAGEEVAFPADLAATIDGKPGSVDDLRAGQVIAMQAAGPAESLLAREIVVRHVVIGPVQSNGDGVLVVAGQQVVVGDAKGTASYAAPGQFVAVSGFREPGGVIFATRIDPAPPGPVILRGELTRIYGVSRIGSQTVRLPDAAIPAGFSVLVTGKMEGAVLVADNVARDIADESPVTYFGPSVSNFVVEGYLSVTAGGYFVNRDFVRGDGYRAGSQGRGIARFGRQGRGGLVARGLQFGANSTQIPSLGRSFTPAPVPGGFNPGSRAGNFGGTRRPGTVGQGGLSFSPRQSPSPDFQGQGNAGPSGPQFMPQRR